MALAMASRSVVKGLTTVGLVAEADDGDLGVVGQAARRR